MLGGYGNRMASRFALSFVDNYQAWHPYEKDHKETWLNVVAAVIPDRLKERVFVLGVWTNPEELRRECGESYERIGLAMAKDCRDNTETTWETGLLSHNAGELERLRKHVRSILFPRG